ncbi:M23 family metallopeptidase [Aestuariibaculum suncheonense]|uniref:M23 family metallopeptidase n=1 Tax=Aestuariibaculum suncheonense TaxID=1028745 RepID=A0A8J6Q7X6_9FLAO|nr:M23 family metallopeptidase [Aestuariibaculum suncheonense]MBD0835717.1 M23 family metallopeptidase [Aestuariibaculum suncheonense]
MRLVLFLLTTFSLITQAQNPYPQDYFGHPLEVPLILSGTFAELRSNHFHSGMDIKTQQREGLRVIAAADGFVSRIKISHYGYGKALYITHPNGYTTVYAHLQKFAPEIEAYVKERQYEAESYEIELFPSANEIRVNKGEHVAFSGNTGGSGGPHLHFEIRNKDEHTLNPMLFGISIADTTKPTIKSIYAYPLNDSSTVNNSGKKQKLRLIPMASGDYTTENIEAYGTIGIGIETNDRQNLAANSNGVYQIQSFLNGNQNFEINFKSFSFDETRNINQLIDYEHYTETKHRIQRLFNQNNTLSLYSPEFNNGHLTIKDSTNAIYKIRVVDYEDNDAWVTINIKGNKTDISQSATEQKTPYYIYANQSTNLKSGNVSVHFYPETFYKNFYIDFKVKNDTLTLHKDIIPTRNNFNINFNVSHYKGADKDKLYVSRLVGRKSNYPVYTETKRVGDTLIASTKYLGSYTLTADTMKPTITPVNFKNEQWLSNYRFLKLKIDDSGSGISNYRATINGKWILMEYEYKNNTLTFDFNDHISTETKNNFKLIVTDNVGNSSTFESVFYRKN